MVKVFIILIVIFQFNLNLYACDEGENDNEKTQNIHFSNLPYEIKIRIRNFSYIPNDLDNARWFLSSFPRVSKEFYNLATDQYEKPLINRDSWKVILKEKINTPEEEKKVTVRENQLFNQWWLKCCLEGFHSYYFFKVPLERKKLPLSYLTRLTFKGQGTPQEIFALGTIVLESPILERVDLRLGVWKNLDILLNILRKSSSLKILTLEKFRFNESLFEAFNKYLETSNGLKRIEIKKFEFDQKKSVAEENLLRMIQNNPNVQFKILQRSLSRGCLEKLVKTNRVSIELDELFKIGEYYRSCKRISDAKFYFKEGLKYRHFSSVMALIDLYDKEQDADEVDKLIEEVINKEDHYEDIGGIGEDTKKAVLTNLKLDMVETIKKYLYSIIEIRNSINLKKKEAETNSQSAEAILYKTRNDRKKLSLVESKIGLLLYYLNKESTEFKKQVEEINTTFNKLEILESKKINVEESFNEIIEYFFKSSYENGNNSVLNNLIKIYFKQSKFREAFDVLHKADTNVFYDKPNIKFLLGHYYQKINDLKEAKKNFKRSGNAGHIYAKVKLGLIYFRENKLKRSESLWLEAESLGNCYAMYWLGKLNLDLEREEEGIKWMVKAYQNGNSWATYYLGQRSSRVEKKYEQALKYFNECISQGYKTSSVYNDIGWLYLNKLRGKYNHFTEAIKNFEIALSLEPNNYSALKNYGWLLFLKAKNEDSTILLEEALTKNKKALEICKSTQNLAKHISKIEENIHKINIYKKRKNNTF